MNGSTGDTPALLTVRRTSPSSLHPLALLPRLPFILPCASSFYSLYSQPSQASMLPRSFFYGFFYSLTICLTSPFTLVNFAFLPLSCWSSYSSLISMFFFSFLCTPPPSPSFAPSPLYPRSVARSVKPSPAPNSPSQGTVGCPCLSCYPPDRIHVYGHSFITICFLLAAATPLYWPRQCQTGRPFVKSDSLE